MHRSLLEWVHLKDSIKLLKNVSHGPIIVFQRETTALAFSTSEMKRKF